MSRSAVPKAAPGCTSHDLLRRISDKWTLLIGVELASSPRHFGELARTVEGISRKMLAQTLRNLERDGLVTRTVVPSMPVTVEYALSPLGMTLVRPVQILTRWTEAHVTEVSEARSRFDRAHK